MPIHIPRGTADPVLERFIEALRVYEADHPGARIDLYRQNPVSVRVRIVDPRFAGRGRVDRHREVERYLRAVPDEEFSDLSSLILLAPEETARSLANLEFEDPVPSVP